MSYHRLLIARRLSFMQPRTVNMTGLSMIEVLVTLLIISVGLIGQAILQTTSVKESFDAAQRSQAAWQVQELVERIRANTDGQSDGYATAIANEALCDDGPTKVCSDHFDGTNKVDAATDCTADEMAEFDVWEMACGFEFAGATSSAREQMLLTDTGFTLICEDADVTDADLCAVGSDFTASLNWMSASAEQAATGETSEKAVSFTVRP